MKLIRSIKHFRESSVLFGPKHNKHVLLMFELHNAVKLKGLDDVEQARCRLKCPKLAEVMVGLLFFVVLEFIQGCQRESKHRKWHGKLFSEGTQN